LSKVVLIVDMTKIDYQPSSYVLAYEAGTSAVPYDLVSISCEA